MNALETTPAVRAPGLVSSRIDGNGRYLVRNRRTGESFQLGAEEHFLLERLDGRHNVERICVEFAEKFGESLSTEELDEFVELSTERGLLQTGSSPTEDELIAPLSLDALETAPPLPSAKPRLRARWEIRLLKGVSRLLGGLVWLPIVAGRRMEKRIRHLEFVPRSDDVFVVTYPRSGTTWMQMILYQLTTDGSMDFPHVAEYCPWFERSLRARRAFETRPSPRLFKSHLPYGEIPKGPCKYVYVARDGRDVAVSYYHLNRTYNSYEGSFERFFELFLEGKTPFGCWLEHVEGWWAHRNDRNVLCLTYEQLSRDLEECVARIAEFIGRKLPPQRFDDVVERCRFAYMKRYEEKFDPAMESLWEQGVQLKSFLRHGRTGESAVCLTEAQRARFADVFAGRLERLGEPFT